MTIEREVSRTMPTRKRTILSSFAPLFFVTAVFACGASERDPFDGGGGGASGSATANGGSGTSDTHGSSGAATMPGSSGAANDPGSAGANDSAGSGSLSSGAGGAGSTGTPGTPPTMTTGPHFSGTGVSFRPLTVGCGPETAGQCTGSCEQQGGAPDTKVIRPPATLCFAGEGDPTPDDPSAVIEQVIESSGGHAYVHIRVTFDPAFTDTTFGAGSCCGWPAKRGHRFSDLTSSDHTELLLTNAAGDTVMNFKIDLLSADPSADCKFGTLGVTGGDGSVIVGDAADVLAVSTSLDRNLNGCGYCKSSACASSGDCTVDSPTTDAEYTPNPQTPNWDYRQVYEVWIDLGAFGDQGFGQAYITYTHSSPAKGKDTLDVEPTPCPPTWDTPYCPPGASESGCFGSGGGTGSGGSGGMGEVGGAGGASERGGSANGGNSGSGGSTGACPPNYQVYLATEGASSCTPIPFANYPDHAACPEGYVLDTASEGQYCLPQK